ncbi:MAG: DUF1573 domain-containing protein [Vicingaceae bacterium]
MKFYYTLILTSVILACGGNENPEITTDLVNNPNSATETDVAMPAMAFDEESFDFGDISQGEKVEHSFIFENTGEADLIISSATGSCGCTVPSYPKEPIKPGQKSEILVVFDSNGKQGAQHKRVTIMANTNPNQTVIAIMANVLTPEEI